VDHVDRIGHAATWAEAGSRMARLIRCGWLGVNRCAAENDWPVSFPEFRFNLILLKSVQTSKIHRKLSRTQKNIKQSSFESF
jgi:hypothetical protein